MLRFTNASYNIYTAPHIQNNDYIKLNNSSQEPDDYFFLEREVYKNLLETCSKIGADWNQTYSESLANLAKKEYPLRAEIDKKGNDLLLEPKEISNPTQ